MLVEIEKQLAFPRFWCPIPDRDGSFSWYELYFDVTVKNFRQASRYLRLKKAIVSQLLA